jgi:hypothetical protein
MGARLEFKDAYEVLEVMNCVDEVIPGGFDNIKAFGVGNRHRIVRAWISRKAVNDVHEITDFWIVQRADSGQ